MRSWVSGSCSRSSASLASIESSACRAWWRGSSRMSSTQLTSSRCSREMTASLTRVGAHQGARSPRISATASGLATSQAWSSSRARSTSPWCRSSRTVSSSRLPMQRRDRLRVEARHQHVAHQLLDVVLADPAERVAGDLGDLVDGPPGVLGYGEPAAHPQRDRRGGGAVADDLLLEEVLPHELLERAAQLVLALRDQRRVRDRQPERVLEERGDREPVRDRAHHRRLGAGVDEAPEPVLAERRDVHDRGQDQQADGERAHPAQALAPALVGIGVGRDHRERWQPSPAILPYAQSA